MVFHTKRMVIWLIMKADTEAEIKNKTKTKKHLCIPVLFGGLLSSDEDEFPGLLFNCAAACPVNISYFSGSKARLLFHLLAIPPFLLMGISQASSPASQLCTASQASICQVLCSFHCASPSAHFQGC